MKQVLKNLKHNGIFVPTYDYKGSRIKIQDQSINLTPKSEQMAIAWVRKTQSTLSPPDRVFQRNFMIDFFEQLKLESPSSSFLPSFSTEILERLGKGITNGEGNPKPVESIEIDFSEISNYLEQEKLTKLNMTPSEKKQLTTQRKALREARKEKFGYAIVDGEKLEIANWTAEPPCFFAGRGNHPKRGQWKEGPREEDIILNLSPDNVPPPGDWKAIVWEPNRMYVAKWVDKLSGKIKYVWFSDSAFVKQNREKEKFKKAAKLGKRISKIEAYIIKNLCAEDEAKRKIATVCWLILKPNMRVGDEKDPGEADTIGAITLRPEHIQIEGDVLHFNFLGKDSVRWIKKIKAPTVVIRNIKDFADRCEIYLFEGLDSKKVSRFLSQKMPGLTAKVFRTWRCTSTVKRYLDKCEVVQEHPVYLKKFNAKIANLKAAQVANHKRKVPAKYDGRLAKKEYKLKDLKVKLEEKKTAGKKIGSLVTRIEKTKLDIKLTKLSKEYNLGTSLKSYIDPKVYVRWADKVNFPLDKFYPKTLRRKFAWAIKGTTE